MLAIALLQASCGAMVNGPMQSVGISTIPPGAELTVEGRTYRSPAQIELDRGRDYEVTARLDGFAAGTRRVHSRPDASVKVGNCLLFLCLPQLWEQGESSQRRLEPESIEIMLDPIGWSPR
jgi:hypothetical protein